MKQLAISFWLVLFERIATLYDQAKMTNSILLGHLGDVLDELCRLRNTLLPLTTIKTKEAAEVNNASTNIMYVFYDNGPAGARICGAHCTASVQNDHLNEPCKTEAVDKDYSVQYILGTKKEKPQRVHFLSMYVSCGFVATDSSP